MLVATSGDTGSAVAQAFHGVPGTRVVVLYPEGKVSDGPGGAVDDAGRQRHRGRGGGTFDDCQRLVKQAFADRALRRASG